MIRLRWEEGQAPIYATPWSAGADLLAAEALVIPPQAQRKVRTGTFIDDVSWDEIPQGLVPELQIRPRSGLALKHGITLVNAPGTVDCDYRDEICVLLWNTSPVPFAVERGERIAQLVLNMVRRIAGVPSRKEARMGGFGSTGQR